VLTDRIMGRTIKIAKNKKSRPQTSLLFMG
jgi:hypothetical protein